MLPISSKATAQALAEQLAEPRRGAVVDRGRLLGAAQPHEEVTHRRASAGCAPAPRRPAARTSVDALLVTKGSAIPQSVSDLELALARLGYTEFRPGQREAIETLFARGRLLLVAPTGGGKSLSYQLPATI